MTIKLTPISILSASALFGITFSIVIILLAIQQPFIGLNFTPYENNIQVSRAYGPSNHIPVNTVIKSISDGVVEKELNPVDLTIEPDGAIEYYSDYKLFLEKQGVLAGMMASEKIIFTDINDKKYNVTPENVRPISTLPVKFWVQFVVGLFAWFISSAVFAFRSKEKSAQYLLLSGLSTLIFAPFTAVYSTRELAMPETLFTWLSDGNFFGGSLFTASFLALLLHYPKRIAPNWIGPTLVAIYIIWFILQQVDVFTSMTFARRILVLFGIICSFILAGYHWFKTQNDPVARATLQWFLISWMLGTMLFSFFILMPQMFGINTADIQGYAFLLFLLVYGGLAFGILKYRLFDLGRWWGAIVIWATTILILILLDLLFLFVLQLSNSLSLSLALLISGLLWLPLRSLIWGRFLDKETYTRDDLFKKIIDIALKPTNSSLTIEWQQLLKQVFNPLEIKNIHSVQDVSIENDGLVLQIPEINLIPALSLNYAHNGRKLFTSKDVKLAEELSLMLEHALESKSSYEKGIMEERRRISRDMHDNIGAQLMGALHNKNPERKDNMIRETLSDLRDIINDASRPNLSFDEILADLRIETVERLSSAGIQHNWLIKSDNQQPIDPNVMHALRSVIREAISNIIKHSDAKRANIKIRQKSNEINVLIDDNGKGYNFKSNHQGNGLLNMQSRVTNLKGMMEFKDNDPGLHLAVILPLNINRKN